MLSDMESSVYGSGKGGSNDARDEEVGCPIIRIGVQLSRLNAIFNSYVPIEVSWCLRFMNGRLHD